MEVREPLSRGIEEMIAGARRTNNDVMAAEKFCPKCGGRWWELRSAVLRDANRGGAQSRFRTHEFNFFVCVGCGYTEIQDSSAPGSRDARFWFGDFVKTITGGGKHKAIDPDEPTIPTRKGPAKIEEALTAIVEEVTDKRVKKGTK